MSFWMGMARAAKDADQRKHERELFASKVKEKQDSLASQIRAQRAEGMQEAADEDLQKIHKAADVLGGDIEVAATLYHNNQLDQFLDATYEPWLAGEIAEGWMPALVSKVRGMEGDNLEAVSDRVMRGLNTAAGADITSESGQRMVLAGAMSARNLEEQSERAPLDFTGAFREDAAKDPYDLPDYNNVRRNVADVLIGHRYKDVAQIKPSEDGKSFEIVPAVNADPNRYAQFQDELDKGIGVAFGFLRQNVPVEEAFRRTNSHLLGENIQPDPAGNPGEPDPMSDPNRPPYQPGMAPVANPPAVGTPAPTAPPPVTPQPTISDNEGDTYRTILGEEF